MPCTAANLKSDDHDPHTYHNQPGGNTATTRVQEHYKILELHRHGIRLEHGEDFMKISTFLSTVATESFLTLAQVATLESSSSLHSTVPPEDDYHHEKTHDTPTTTSRPSKVTISSSSSPAGNKRPNSKSKQKYFNFTACVDAISPIITAHPKDPFALIEL